MVNSSRSQSSEEGSTTIASLAVAVTKVTEGFQTFQDLSFELKLALQLEGGGPWPGFPRLTEERLQELLEALEDPHSELLIRSETRAREIERTAELDEEDFDYQNYSTETGSRESQTRRHQPT